MSFQVEMLPPEIFLHVHDEILADGGKRGLLHNFQPQPPPGPRPAGLRRRRGAARLPVLSTFHTFPDEHTVVKTQSLIERK